MSGRRSRSVVVILASAGLALAAATQAAGFGRFKDSQSIPVDIAYQVAIGDLSGDGIADIAASQDSNSGTDGVVVANGVGNGKFGPPRLVPATTEAVEGVAIGKFNADKRRDIAMSDYDHSTIALMYGQKGGTFKAGPVLDSGPGAFPLVAADLNGDGRTDIVSANYYSLGPDEVSVLLQKKGGGFRPHVDYAGSSDTGYALAIGRVDRDKHPDVVVQSFDGSFAVLRGRANGTLRAPLTRSLPGGHGVHNIAIGDYNHDGKTDVAAGDRDDSEIDIFLGTGNGTFGQPKATDLHGLGPAGVAAGDYNRDGKLDVAVSGASKDEVDVLFGKGNGRFRATPSVTPTTNGSEDIVAGRLDADKGPDLVVGTYTSADVLLNKK